MNLRWRLVSVWAKDAFREFASNNRYLFDVMFAGNDHLSEPVYLEPKKNENNKTIFSILHSGI